MRCVGAGDDRPDVSQDGEVRDRDDVRARVASGIAVGAELGQQARDVDARLLGELASRRLVQCLLGLNPPGIAHMPLYGSWPRRTRRTWRTPSAMVRMTTSTVTAKAGNVLASYPGGTFALRVLVSMTLTLSIPFWSCQPKHASRSAHEERCLGRSPGLVLGHDLPKSPPAAHLHARLMPFSRRRLFSVAMVVATAACAAAPRTMPPPSRFGRRAPPVARPCAAPAGAGPRRTRVQDPHRGSGCPSTAGRASVALHAVPQRREPICPPAQRLAATCPLGGVLPAVRGTGVRPMPCMP